jgi:hypothetical protein
MGGAEVPTLEHTTMAKAANPSGVQATKPAAGASAPAVQTNAQPAQQTALARALPGGAGGGQLARVSELAYNFVALGDPNNEAGGNVALALKENLGGAEINAFDFERVKVPAGGGLAWNITDQDTGDETALPGFEAVIVAWKDQKAFWKRSLSEDGAKKGPPDCYSPDMKKGIGDPGVVCATCRFNKFGTAKGGTGRGKACKDTRQIFFMRPASLLPELLVVPPTSLQAVKSFMLKLASRGIPFWQCVVKFKLVKDKNAESVEYSKVDLSLVAVLDDLPKAAAQKYSHVVRQMLGVRTILPTQEELEGDGIGGYDDQSTANARAVAMNDAQGENTQPSVDEGDWTNEATESA